MNKTILVGIDFSDCSLNALEHALSIAQKSEANLMLIWVNKPDNTKNLYELEGDEILQKPKAN